MRIALRTTARCGTGLKVGVKIGGRGLAVHVWNLRYPRIYKAPPCDQSVWKPGVSPVVNPQVILDTNI